jgi:tripartite-type tricarboxylate transporter receptor subunit TctC
MNINRRAVLRTGGYALALSLGPFRFAQAAADIKAVRVISPLSKPSIGWTALDLLRPAVQRNLNCAVVVETIPGHDGFDAIHAALEPHDDEVRLFGTGIMATQYVAKLVKTDIRLEDLLPIAKVTNGFSMTLFAKRGGPLATWADLAAAKAPLKMSSLQRQTATYIAVLMAQRKGALSAEDTMRDTLGEVIDDVTAGRSALGIANTGTVARHLDELQPIVSFGAERNMMLSGTPTFAEAMGDPKLAYTESIGVFASPKLAPDIAARLTQAFMAAGNDMDVQGMAEAGNIPLAVNGPEVLADTMKRNEEVLARVLG